MMKFLKTSYFLGFPEFKCDKCGKVESVDYVNFKLYKEGIYCECSPEEVNTKYKF